MEAIIFDMDGVVVDSVEYWNELREAVIREELGVDPVDVSELVGMNAGDEYDYLARDHRLRRSKESYVDLLERNASEVYRERVDLLPRFEVTVDTLARNGLSVGLVSAAYRRRVEMVLDRFDLHDRFDVVVAGDDVPGPSKPDPAIYEYALSQLGVDSGGCVAVEDSEHGVSAAKRAGVRCIGYARRSDQQLASADEVVTDPDALADRVIERCRSVE